MEEEKVKLVLINERALTFNADIYVKLRTKHRIMGKLMGAAVPHPRNVAINGLPAYFSEYQTKFMVEHGIAELESKKGLMESPTARMKELYEDHKMKLISEADRLYIETRLDAMKAKMEMIVKGKRAKLIKRGIEEKDIDISPDNILREEESRLKLSLGTSTLTYAQVPTQHPFKLSSNIIKDFPVSNMSKYYVFKDLWFKGFYITNGESFGGDFLIYSDDPMYFHASQIVHVIEDENEKFDLYFAVSCTRLAVSVKKKCTFAYVNEKGTVVYQTMLWENPKLKELYANEKKIANIDEK